MVEVEKVDIGQVLVGRFPIQEIYVGRVLVWEDAAEIGLSCFSCGYWEDTLPWLDTEAWVDNI